MWAWQKIEVDKMKRLFLFSVLFASSFLIFIVGIIGLLEGWKTEKDFWLMYVPFFIFGLSKIQ